MQSQKLLKRWACALLAVVCLALVPRAHASATLLLEEPYGKLGFFAGTGHAAVYLSRVCADSPAVLRRCQPGELGVVISRYHGVARYDWMAIPLIPYLYAVDNSEDIPLFADAKTVAFLRDRYRREHLEEVAPDLSNRSVPGGNWYELVGSSYDRTTYGFEIETTPAQDDALIRKYNTMRNRSRFRTVSSNCADFAREVINFYYPKALHRSFVSDLGMTTPKQAAKMLVRYSQRHPQLEFARFVIPQVPGSVPRSTAVHGVVESFFKSKKYIVPSAVVSPIFAGCVAAVYISGGSGRFDPGHDALVFKADGPPEKPLAREDRRAYAKELDHLLAAGEPQPASGSHVEKAWERLQSKAIAQSDAQGHPILEMHFGSETVDVGLSAQNVFNGAAPAELVQRLLEARLHAELHHTPVSRISESELARDWGLLQRAMNSNSQDEQVYTIGKMSASIRSTQFASGPSGSSRPEHIPGNRQ